MTEQARTPKGTNFRLIGIIIIIAYLTPWIIIAALRWTMVGFNTGTSNDVSFILYTMVLGAGWATSFHLWSRVAKLEGKIRKLFLITGFTFLVLVFLFTYLLLNLVLPWFNVLSLSAALNAVIPSIQFWIFGIEAFKVSIPADSLITFAFLVLAITFYLFPMERYARQKFPWHSLAMFICTALIPLLLLFRDLPDSMVVMSIGTVGVVLMVVYNFFYLFYLYFSLGVQAPKGTPLRKASFMIGFGFLCIILTWIAQWAISIDDGIIDTIIQMSFGAAGIVLFNYGFHLIRPA